jgi:hypothetical protein
MRRPFTSMISCAGLLLVSAACSSEAAERGPAPSQTQIQDIEKSADAAAAAITPENADAELQKLRAEIGK